MAKKAANKMAKRPNSKVKHLETISDIRRYFHRNERPIFFVSATNFNLLGIDEW